MRDEKGKSATICAAMKNHCEVCRCGKRERSFTSHYTASSSVVLQVLQVLVEAKADLDITDEDGCTAAIYAVVYNRIRALKLLIDGGCDLSVGFVLDDDGEAVNKTPLQWAHEMSTEYLDPRIKDLINIALKSAVGQKD